MSTVFKHDPLPATVGQHTVKLARSLYSGRIARMLREAIVDGELAEGTPLVETQLAAELSVSRGPVRSALQVLQGEGLVETRANGRMATVRFGPEDLHDLLSVRHELESSAVRRGSASGGDVEPVRAAFEAFRQEGATTERLVELDIAFHRALVEFGGSRFLLERLARARAGAPGGDHDRQPPARAPGPGLALPPHPRRARADPRAARARTTRSRSCGCSPSSSS